MSFSDEIKTNVILAASIAAGADADDTTVLATTRKIVGRLTEGSAFMAVFDEAIKRDEATVKTKAFPATILYVDRELSSTRAVIFLKTKPSKWHPNGKEIVRTDRTDTAEGLEFARLAQTLVGHKVMLSVAVEGTGEVNVRIVRSIQDNNIDPAYNPNDPEFFPDMDSTPALRELAPKLASSQLVGAGA